MKSRRKTVNDINTINSPRVGRRKKQTYLQLHTLENRRKRLQEELERLRTRMEKAEQNLQEVEKHIQNILEDTEDVQEICSEDSSADSKLSGGGKGNCLEY